MAFKKIIRALAVIALLAAVGNYAKMRYFKPVSNLANSSVVQYDFIKNWVSETAKIEAENILAGLCRYQTVIMKLYKSPQISRKNSMQK